MAQKRAVTTKVKRDLKTGRFIPAKEYLKRKSTEIVNNFKRKGTAKHAKKNSV